MTVHDAPSLAMLLTEVGAFRDEPFTLIDVGCSGGLYEPAHDFMPDIRAVGFDPLISEVDRLNRTLTAACGSQSVPWTLPPSMASW